MNMKMEKADKKLKMPVGRSDVSFWLDLFLPEAGKILPEKDKYPFSILNECLESLRDFMREELFYIARPTLDETYKDILCGENVFMRLCADEYDGEECVNAVRCLAEDLRNKGKDAFAEKAPLLRSLLEDWLTEYCSFIRDMLDDLAKLTVQISAKLFSGHPIKEIIKIESCWENYYSGGKAVTFVSTDCGKFVWKGRDCRIDLWYEHLCDRYFSDYIHVPRTVVCGKRFGVFEFAEHRPAGEDEAYRAAKSLGGFAALSTILGSGDMHTGNVWLRDGKVVPIDLELILKPSDNFDAKLSEIGDEADFSLLYSGLLLNRFADDERSQRVLALYDIGKDVEMPYFSGMPDREQCLGNMISGYKEVFTRCLRLRDELLAELEDTKEFNVRKTCEGGRFYRSFIKKLRHPKSLKSADERNAYIARIQRQRAERNPVSELIIDAENECLLRQHTPYFTMRIDGRDVFYEGQPLLYEYAAVSPFDRTRSILLDLNEQLLMRNIALISAICLPPVLSLPADASLLSEENIERFAGELKDNAVELSNGQLIWFCRLDGSGMPVAFSEILGNQKKALDFCRSAREYMRDSEHKQRLLDFANRIYTF